MRKVTIEYDEHGFEITDSDGNWVNVTYDGDTALFSSRLEGDNEVQVGSCHVDDSEMQALYLFGIPRQ